MGSGNAGRCAHSGSVAEKILCESFPVAQQENPVQGIGAAGKVCFTSLIRTVTYLGNQDGRLLLGREGSFQEIAVHPAAQGTFLPGGFRTFIVIRNSVQAIAAEEQEIAIVFLQSNPFYFLRTVIRIVILFIFPKGEDCPGIFRGIQDFSFAAATEHIKKDNDQKQDITNTFHNSHIMSFHYCIPPSTIPA